MINRKAQFSVKNASTSGGSVSAKVCRIKWITSDNIVQESQRPIFDPEEYTVQWIDGDINMAVTYDKYLGDKKYACHVCGGWIARVPFGVGDVGICKEGHFTVFLPSHNQRKDPGHVKNFATARITGLTWDFDSLSTDLFDLGCTQCSRPLVATSVIVVENIYYGVIYGISVCGCKSDGSHWLPFRIVPTEDFTALWLALERA